MDWQDTLRQFADSNPDLPRGEEPPAAEIKPAGAKPRGAKLQIVMERKGRGGKTATIIAGFPEEVSDDEIDSLARKLKQKLGVGGSVRGGEILIQGDRRQEVSSLLRAEGWKTNI